MILDYFSAWFPVLENAGFAYIFIAFAVNALVAFMVSWRYSVIINHMKDTKDRLSLKDAFKVTCTVQFSSFMFPFMAASFIMKPALVRHITGIKVKIGATGAAIEQIHEFAIHVCLLALLLVFLGRGLLVDSFIIYALLAAALVILFVKRNWILKNALGLKVLLPGMVKRKLKKSGVSKKSMDEVVGVITGCLSSPGLLARITLLSLSFIILLPLVTQFVAMSFNIRISYADALVIYWLSFILGRISNIPNGYGVRDTSMVGLLTVMCGVDPILAVQIAVVHRLTVMLVPYVVFGGPMFFYTGRDVLYRRGLHGKKTA